MKKCLWIVPKLIFPVSDGAKGATQSLIKSIRPYFENLDIVAFREEHENDLHLNLYQDEFRPDKIHVIARPSIKGKFKKIISLLINLFKSSSLPVSVGHYSTAHCRREVKRILVDGNYDLLVFDGLHPYSAFLELQRNGEMPAVVYRAHNVEQDLWVKAALKTENPLKSFLLSWQGKKIAGLERMLIENSQSVWAIASEDLKRFEEITGKKNIYHVPVGLDFLREKIFMPSPLRSQKIKLLFVGEMDWAPNKDGLRWFLHEIWPFIDHCKLELKVVGGGESSWVENFYSFPSVRFLGTLENLDALYAESDFSIFPIRFGAGPKIKVVESISKGVALISTSVGVQGSGLGHGEFILAQDANDWIRVLSSLNVEDSKRQAQEAFLKFEKTYSPAVIGHNAYFSLHKLPYLNGGGSA